MDNNLELGLLKHQWDAVRAISGDRYNDSYEKAVISFKKNDELIDVIKNDVVVISISNSSNRKQLFNALLKEIQDSALIVGDTLTESFKKLNLPKEYELRLDIAKDVRWLGMNLGNHLSAHVRLKGDSDDTEHIKDQIDAEFRVFLDDDPHATLFAYKGPRFFGKNEDLFAEDRQDRFVYANNFQELADKIVEVFNQKIITHAVDPLDKTEEVVNHYSDIILYNLVDHFGWERSEVAGYIRKNVGGGEIGGELNPNGVQIINANFDERGRYLTAYSGFNVLLDIDCRDRDTMEVAEEFDSMIRDKTRKVKKLKLESDELDPTSAEGYVKITGVKSLEEKYQDDLDNLFLSRVVAVRNALLGIESWDYGLKPLFSNEDIVKRSLTKADFKYTYVGAGHNVVGVSVNGIVDDLTKTPEDLAIAIEIKVQETEPKRDRISYGKIVEVNNEIAIQRQGRGKKEIHVLSNLEGNLVQGEDAEIKYSNGRGSVVQKARDIEVGR